MPEEPQSSVEEIHDRRNDDKCEDPWKHCLQHRKPCADDQGGQTRHPGNYIGNLKTSGGVEG